jgi:hypothetical protein
MAKNFGVLQELVVAEALSKVLVRKKEIILPITLALSGRSSSG